MTPSLWAAVAVTAVVAAMAQAAFARAANEAAPLGDEIEYLERATADDAGAPGLFLRVPTFIWFVRWFGGHEQRTRLAQHMVAVCTVAVTTAAVGLVGGLSVAWVSGLVLALLPDRWVFAGRIWPDVLLALHHAVLILLLALADAGHEVSPWWFGLVAAAAVTTRVDAMVLLVVLVCMPLARGDDSIAAAAAMLLAPSAALLLLLALRNRRRYGLFAFDTTLAFNLRVMEREQRDPSITVQDAVQDALEEWTPAQPRGVLRTSLAALGSPWSAATGMLRRLHSMIGADTFARERLLSRSGGWPRVPHRLHRGVAAMLRVSAPLLFGAAAWGLATDSGVSLQFVWPAAAAYLAMCGVHARTRFRQVLFPWLVCWAGLAVASTWESFDPKALLIGVAVATLAVLAPQRRESLS